MEVCGKDTDVDILTSHICAMLVTAAMFQNLAVSKRPTSIIKSNNLVKLLRKKKSFLCHSEFLFVTQVVTRVNNRNGWEVFFTKKLH